MKCKICGNTNWNSSYLGKEMNFGMGDEFLYFKCAKCGCLQIAEIPDDMGKYYPENYYSFHVENVKLKTKLANYLLKNAIQSRLGKFKPIGWIARLYRARYRDLHFYLTNGQFNYNSKILDVGCGIGELLVKMHQWGFRNLAGIDPYLKEDITYFDTVKLYKKEIFDLHENFDLIMLHHSFEHMSNPSAIMSKLTELLSDDGLLIIRIPVVDCYLWRKYQMNWVQVDAPRHFFLHSISSIALLVQMNGLKIKEVKYDSINYPFAISEYYSINGNRCENMKTLSKKDLRLFSKKAKELNRLNDGDQACFVIEKNNKL
ncbi:putative methyltransferase [Bacteroidia bacterium]|nr:putative methyltransferase [Bacteroidia bacterium]GHU66835.1 putative methyltransferase [Bacteroidia bacterium]